MVKPQGVIDAGQAWDADSAHVQSGELVGQAGCCDGEGLAPHGGVQRDRHSVRGSSADDAEGYDKDDCQEQSQGFLHSTSSFSIIAVIQCFVYFTTLIEECKHKIPHRVSFGVKKRGNAIHIIFITSSSGAAHD